MKCKICKSKFEAKFPFQKTCFNTECILTYSKQIINEKRKAKHKKIKEGLKTRSDHLNELQTIFNKWIRLRDAGSNCISCCKPCKKENAGHYRSVGGNPELRFEPLNVHLQCEYCNTYLHGNLINYRINLIKKIGIEQVEWLEGKHELKKYSVEEIKVLKIVYKEKISKL